MSELLSSKKNNMVTALFQLSTKDAADGSQCQSTTAQAEVLIISSEIQCS